MVIVGTAGPRSTTTLTRTPATRSASRRILPLLARNESAPAASTCHPARSAADTTAGASRATSDSTSQCTYPLVNVGAKPPEATRSPSCPIGVPTRVRAASSRSASLGWMMFQWTANPASAPSGARASASANIAATARHMSFPHPARPVVGMPPLSARRYARSTHPRHLVHCDRGAPSGAPPVRSAPPPAARRCDGAQRPRPTRPVRVRVHETTRACACRPSRQRTAAHRRGPQPRPQTRTLTLSPPTARRARPAARPPPGRPAPATPAYAEPLPWRGSTQGAPHRRVPAADDVHETCGHRDRYIHVDANCM